MKKLKVYFHRAIPALIFMVVYFVWFGILENVTSRDYSIIHLSIDDKIPFCEYFIIPYIAWFFYVAWIIIYLLFTDEEGYKKCCAFLFSGMTVFLIVSTLFPSVQYLRPCSLPHDNFCSRLVAYLYQIDTNTNIWPSIHVYNAIGAYIAVAHSKRLGKNPVLNGFCLFLTSAIIVSTVVLKQHSMFDVMTAFVMAAFFYVLAYRMDVLAYIHRMNFSFAKKKRKSRRYIN